MIPARGRGRNRGRKGSYGLLLSGGFAILLGITSAAGTLVESVSDGGGFLFDGTAIELAQDVRNPGLTSAMRALTTAGSAGFLAVLVVALAMAFYALRRREAAVLFLTSCFAGSVALYQVAKWVVGRPRPDLEPLTGFGGSSWPSGHATGAAAVFIGIALLFGGRGNRLLRALIWFVAGAITVLVGLSRVYLGVHWASDVIWGIVIGAAWAIVCSRATSRSE